MSVSNVTPFSNRTQLLSGKLWLAFACDRMDTACAQPFIYEYVCKYLRACEYGCF